MKKSIPTISSLVILWKGSPKLSSPVAAMQPLKVSRDSSPRNLESELQQLAMDAGSAPGRVLVRQSAERNPSFVPSDRLARLSASGSKAPVQTEPFPVPSNHCVRLHDQKRLRPLRLRSAQQNSEQSVGTAQVGPLSPAFQDPQLLPQCYDFQSQVMTRPNKASQPREHNPNQPKHESVLIPTRKGWPLRSPGLGFDDLQREL